LIERRYAAFFSADEMFISLFVVLIADAIIYAATFSIISPFRLRFLAASPPAAVFFSLFSLAAVYFD